MTARLHRHRDFALLWAGQSVSDVGTAVSIVVLPLVAIGYLHATAFEVAALAALEWLPWLLLGLVAGVWVDRSAKRRLLVWCDVLRAVLLASVPVAAACGALTIAQLLAVAFGLGVATVVFQIAYQAYLPVVVDRADLPEANAKLQGSQSVASFAGPGVGGFLVQVVRAPFALIVDTASYVVSAVALLFMRTAEPPPVRRSRSVRQDVAEGVRFVARDPLLRTLTIAPGLANLFFGGYSAITVLFLVRGVGLAPGSVGLLVGLTSLGSVAGAFLARPLGRRLGTARVMWVSSAVTVPAGLLIPLTHTGAGLAFFLTGQVLLLAGVIVYNISIGAFRQAYCPPELLGRVVASMRVVLFGTMPIGSLAAGGLATATDPRTAAFVLLGGNLLSTVALVLSPLRRMRDLPDRPPAGLQAAARTTAHT